MPRAGASSQTVDAGGLLVHLLSAGSGPPLVLLHGFPQTSHEWRHVIGPLSRRRLVVAPDQRGFGETARPFPPRMSRALLARDLEATLDALGFGVVDLAGHDWGGMIASAFAFTRPERVRRLVLIDTAIERFVLRAAWHLLWFKVPALAERTFSEDAAAFVRGTLRGLSATAGVPAEPEIEHYVESFGHPATRAIAISLYRDGLPLFRIRDAGMETEHVARVPAAEIRAAWNAGIGGHPLWKETASIAPAVRSKRFPRPTLWVHATGLGRPNASFRMQFERAFPDLETVEVDCGHWIPEERPGELVETLERFLA